MLSTLSKNNTAELWSAGGQTGALKTAAKASAPRLAWCVAVLTYSSPIKKLKGAGQPFWSVATATMKPVVLGSTSEVKNDAVWLAVKQMKLSADVQSVDCAKNRWTTAVDVVLVFVMLIRVFLVAGLAASEV